MKSFKTEKGSTNTPVFKRLNLSSKTLCEAGNEENTELKFVVRNFKEGGNHGEYGQVLVNMSKLRESTKHYLDFGNGNMLKIENFNYKVIPNFLDYLRVGWFINMAAAIDYTASNGELSESSSLHKQYEDGVTLNNYEKAITSVGSVLEPYAYMAQIAAFGFGGVPRFAG